MRRRGVAVRRAHLLEGNETIAIVVALIVAALGLWHLAGNPRITVTGATYRVSAGQVRHWER